jgi:hypothetical protein
MCLDAVINVDNLLLPFSLNWISEQYEVGSPLTDDASLTDHVA